jgi:hypothetical protein
VRLGLEGEVGRLDTTLQRLATMRNKQLSLANIFGNAAQGQTLLVNLERWMIYPEKPSRRNWC